MPPNQDANVLLNVVRNIEPPGYNDKHKFQMKFQMFAQTKKSNYTFSASVHASRKLALS